jgi:hypothetical protein
VVVVLPLGEKVAWVWPVGWWWLVRGCVGKKKKKEKIVVSPLSGGEERVCFLAVSGGSCRQQVRVVETRIDVPSRTDLLQLFELIVSMSQSDR